MTMKKAWNYVKIILVVSTVLLNILLIISGMGAAWDVKATANQAKRAASSNKVTIEANYKEFQNHVKEGQDIKAQMKVLEAELKNTQASNTELKTAINDLQQILIKRGLQ